VQLRVLHELVYSARRMGNADIAIRYRTVRIIAVLSLVACRSVVSNQRSCSTLGPVSTWMGDCLRAGKPSRYKANQLGRLSLLPSVGW